MKLSEDEYKVLSKITTKAKMDWFDIRECFDQDYVYDLEYGKKLSLKTGIGFVWDGFTEPSDYDLKEKETKTFYNLLIKLGYLKEDL